MSGRAKAKHGIARWNAAMHHSWKGLKYAWRHEAAVREELVALVISIPLSLVVAQSSWQAVTLVLSVLFVLIVEILNSSLEATLDRVSTDHHPLTGAAKDLGSLAVLLAIVLSAALWITAWIG